MKKNKPIRIALLGMGTVGCGVFNVLKKNKEEIERRLCRSIEVAYVCARDANKDRPIDLQGLKISTDPMQAVNDPTVDIVVELIGGCELAGQLVEQAIANGKHIVTANKALIATQGKELLALAQDKEVVVAYEAAVAGGIPIVKVLREGLAANAINRVVGIVNGTTNYILSEVSEKHRSFGDALAEAQALGYAEADPSFDVNGTDAAHKLTILASIALGIPLQFEKVYRESSEGIEVQDVIYAEELGYCIKHLATAKRSEKGIELRVHPALIPQKSLLANVKGVMNAVMVDGNAVGPTLYYGAGAGAEQTASAVIADLIDVARSMDAPAASRVPYLAFDSKELLDIPILDIQEIVSDYYLRLQIEDCPGALASITQVLSDSNISVEAVIQKEALNASGFAPLVLLIHPVKGKDIAQAKIRIEQLEVVQDKVIGYRLEQL